MKAVLTKEVGGPETLVVEQIDAVQPGKGEVLVDIAACAINFPDTLMIRDMYQFKPERPYSPGGEISGTISAVGDGVDGWQVGDRVLAGIGSGGLREQVAIDAAKLFKVPQGVDLVEASALLMTYGTMIHALKDRGDIKPGDTVLVLGAAGGAGWRSVGPRRGADHQQGVRGWTQGRDAGGAGHASRAHATAGCAAICPAGGPGVHLRRSRWQRRPVNPLPRRLKPGGRGCGCGSSSAFSSLAASS